MRIAVWQFSLFLSFALLNGVSPPVRDSGRAGSAKKRIRLDNVGGEER